MELTGRELTILYVLLRHSIKAGEPEAPQMVILRKKLETLIGATVLEELAIQKASEQN